jgi:hypothetical protein
VNHRNRSESLSMKIYDSEFLKLQNASQRSSDEF